MTQQPSAISVKDYIRFIREGLDGVVAVAKAAEDGRSAGNADRCRKPVIEPIGQTSPPRHLLPQDLPGALARLDDGEIDVLLAAVIEEAKRRGRLPSSLVAKPREEHHRPNDPSHSKVTAMHTAASLSRLSPQGGVPSLSRGQMNAVRAAFKAGVKPSMIARQFGVSQSDVRKVLASDTQAHKG
jgi:hypothetical protein